MQFKSRQMGCGLPQACGINLFPSPCRQPGSWRHRISDTGKAPDLRMGVTVFTPDNIPSDHPCWLAVMDEYLFHLLASKPIM